MVIDGLLAGRLRRPQAARIRRRRGRPAARGSSLHAEFARPGRRRAARPRSASTRGSASAARRAFALEPRPGARHLGRRDRARARSAAAPARCTTLWLRWPGPLGLAHRQAHRALDAARCASGPTSRRSARPTLQTFLRDAQFGLIARRIRGEGTQFEALSEYEPGMDRRRIDWKIERAPRPALRARERGRARQPDRVRVRLRPGDVRAGRRPAADRPRGLGRADGGLCRAQGRRPGGAVRVRRQARADDPVRADARALPPPADRRRGARLRAARAQLHARAGDADRAAQAPLADRAVLRFRRPDLGRADGRERRAAGAAPPGDLRDHGGRRAGRPDRGRARQRCATSPPRSPPTASPASARWCCSGCGGSAST